MFRSENSELRGYSMDQRLKEIYSQSSDILHFRPESFRLYPVMLSTGQRRWSALGPGWSPHYAIGRLIAIDLSAIKAFRIADPVGAA